MILQDLENYLQENGDKNFIKLLKNNLTITEKINGTRIYCRKENSGNLLFYTKNKNNPLNPIDRFLSDKYELFIKHIIKYKDKFIQNGVYGFYIVENKFILTNPPNNINIEKFSKEINVLFSNLVFNGKLSENNILEIITYITNGSDILELIYKICNKNIKTIKNIIPDVIEGYIFKIENEGFFKLKDNLYNKKEFLKQNTTTYELLLIEIFNFILNFDFINIKLNIKNLHLRKLEFIFELFNNFIDYCKENNMLENLLTSPPEFINTKGNLTKKYVCNNKTLEIIKENVELEYLLRVFVTALKGEHKIRGILTQENIDIFNNIIKNIDDYINRKDIILDYSEFKKFKINI